MTTTQTYRTVIYGRVSMRDRQEALNQLGILREDSERDPQLELTGEYIDQESGGSADRAEFRRLFEEPAPTLIRPGALLRAQPLLA